MYIASMRTRVHEEIRQAGPFPRLETEALVALLRTAAVLEHAMAEALKPYGVTPTQYNVLRMLRGAGEGGLCGRDVGERLISRVPDVPRLLERLEETGLIRRERDARDRRHVTARITESGLRVLEETTPVLERVERERFASVGEEELHSLVRALDAVRNVR
jgi:DNA-binding MarR family transcriptional regulator